MQKRETTRHIVVQTTNAIAMRQWLCEKLFFQAASENEVYNGDCVFRFVDGESCKPAEISEDFRYVGLGHVALSTADIRRAMEYCQSVGLTMVTQGNDAFFNPKVFGKGEFYFHIQTPFGFTLEIAQRVEQPTEKRNTQQIMGIDHIGVPCSNLEREIKALHVAGFIPLFEPVLNDNDTDGRIRCCMLSDGMVTLEVYQFLDRKSVPMPQCSPIYAIGSYPPMKTPGGLILCS